MSDQLNHEASDKTKCVRQNKGIVFSEVDDEIVTFNMASMEYVGLNKAAVEIWKLMAHSTNIETLTQQLLIKYDVNPKSLEADIEAFIKAAIQKNLIEVTRESVFNNPLQISACKQNWSKPEVWEIPVMETMGGLGAVSDGGGFS